MMPSLRKVFVCVNGILNLPGKSQGWTDRAVTWLHVNTPHTAEKWEYMCGPLSRRLRQQSRARKIATLLHFYEKAGFEIVLVGHSNGCDLIARVLALRGRKSWYFAQPISAAHLFAPAADWSDYRRALDAVHLRRLHLYGSEGDLALKVARISRFFFGWLGLGYGTLGLHADEVEYNDRCAQADLGLPPRVFDHSRDYYGHSTWFERGARFEGTMSCLIANEKLHS